MLAIIDQRIERICSYRRMAHKINSIDGLTAIINIVRRDRSLRRHCKQTCKVATSPVPSKVEIDLNCGSGDMSTSAKLRDVASYRRTRQYKE